MVFLEYNVDASPTSRISRFYAAVPGGTVSLPLVMVDSGNDVTAGVPPDYYTYYQSKVNTSLARPAKAEVNAFWERIGNQVQFTVYVKNLSGVTLSSSNVATVHAIVYEEARLQLTNRFVINAISTPINPGLADGDSRIATLQTGNLSGVDWDKLRFLAIVDYRPNGTSGKYDMLQAALATLPPEVDPEQLTFLVDDSNPLATAQYAQVQGPAGMTWNASKDPGATWLNVTANGSPSTPVQFSLNIANLVSGWNETVVTFSSPDGLLSDQVTVKAYLGSISTLFLPLMAKQ